MTIVIAVVLAVACVVIVALPYLREPAARDDRLDAPDPRERRRLELAEQRDRALAALKELEFDHRTGKVSDEDYRAQVGPLRREAAEALRSLETASPGPASLKSAGVAGAGEGNDASMSVIEPPSPPDVPEPFPPPDEGDPPEPAAPPEPYPPPDEADPPEQPRIPEPGPL